MTDHHALAALLFPHAEVDLAKIHARYPARDLPDGAHVTRFGPSPTGFMHIGGVLAALLNFKLSGQTGGVFILRIEDTDQAREIEGGVALITEALAEVGIRIDEGPEESGPYGPYEQSKRLDLYHAFARDLVARGLAYPCFLREDELAAIRAEQEQQKVTPGVYGEWARSRNLTLDDVRAKIEAGERWVLRLRTAAQVGDRIQFEDRLRGTLELPANALDTVIIKADGFPTYHFAHPVDDTLMRMTLIIRGDEWISSTPIHLQIFEALGVERPPIAHIAPIQKIDEKEDGTKSRRKLSKRHDPEASMTFYREKGYPPAAIVEYLLNLLDSAFEDWRVAHPDRPYAEFELSLDRLSRSGALFDLVKLDSVSQEVIARFSAEELFTTIRTWAHRYDARLAAAIDADPDLAKRAFNIGRDDDPPRKDISAWSRVADRFGWFFEAYFDAMTPAPMPDLGAAEIRNVLEFAVGQVDAAIAADASSWIAPFKEHALANGYAKNPKVASKNPELYKAAFGEFMSVARIAITGSRDSPDLHQVMRILGADTVRKRLRAAMPAA